MSLFRHTATLPLAAYLCWVFPATVPRRISHHFPTPTAAAVTHYHALHDSATRCLEPLVADLPGRRALRSASTSRLVIPPIKLSTVGSRAFPVAAAQVWNSLSEAVISSSSPQTFRRHLKDSSFSTVLSTPDSLTACLASLQWSL